ncbi:transporter [Lentzea sp. NBRC 105346]|uniref:hypothetical protein n=1 Tax=Lentzea sp. NBRC 105346 TaxID=3032205 RepID=UPI0024A4731F|nr:hypothetical protein [Lentzea sp. NBRC 105346]GLZ35675.1 transporter [Lentzea sp. NBRC 105346]
MKAMVWLTWRQHRWVLLSTAVLALIASSLLVAVDLTESPGRSVPLPAFYAVLLQTAFGAVIGMFWGAPLVAREFEERTHLVAWGQDVTPQRWLAGKVGVLAVFALVLAVLMGQGDGFRGYQDGASWALFEAHPLVQAGYVLLGLALGVLFGLLARHTLTAMAFTLAAYVGVRMLLALGWREHYLPAERAVAPVREAASVPKGAEIVASGYLGGDGEPMAVPDICARLSRPAACIAANGGTDSYVDYQPVERVFGFQVTEFLVCFLLALGLFVLAHERIRRGWRPSRTHRRLA